jgi:hypothetical protein
MIADTQKKAKCKFFELGIEDRKRGSAEKIENPFLSKLCFLFIFPIQFSTLLSILETDEERKNVLLAYQLEMDIEKIRY